MKTIIMKMQVKQKVLHLWSPLMDTRFEIRVRVRVKLGN